MEFVFPLLVEGRRGFGLDFGSCQTWVVFAEGAPMGGVTFRIHHPLTHGARTKVMPVLEVLFIAVEEDARQQKLGSAMVKVLEKEALAAGVEIMYVEIGRMQSEARQFWVRNGMCLVREQLQPGAEDDYALKDNHTDKTVGVPPEMAHFFENRCLRFDDTEQWVKQISAEGVEAQEGEYVEQVWDIFQGVTPG